MGYFSRLWLWSFSLVSLPLNMDKWLFRLPKGWKFTWGVWARYTVDGPGLPPSINSGKQYKYAPLDQSKARFRLLDIHAGEYQDPIRASLITRDLDQCPPYAALSYTWGSMDVMCDCLVDGQTVTIGGNLMNALRAIRSGSQNVLLWVDAICIDQNCLSDRSNQVSKMAQIYEHAEDVIVYLGEPTEETHLGMVMLQAIMDRHEPEDVPAWLQIPIPVLEKGVADILRRPWFTRMWTVQEATLAHHITMMCGRYRFSWRVELRHVMAAIFRIKATVISPAFDWGAKQQSTLDWLPLLDILEAQSRQAARREGATLHRNQLDLAFTFRHRKAHDPRDKIFAISNIVEHENDEHNKVELRLLHADYEETLEEIHSRFEREIKRIAGIEDAHLE